MLVIAALALLAGLVLLTVVVIGRAEHQLPRALRVAPAVMAGAALAGTA
ncbi:MAG: hypothetical protein M0013_05500 [Actinomycetota bacterium]|nr:hypothetical protein [Actinomycetota bacterium]